MGTRTEQESTMDLFRLVYDGVPWSPQHRGVVESRPGLEPSYSPDDVTCLDGDVHGGPTILNVLRHTDPHFW